MSKTGCCRFSTLPGFLRETGRELFVDICSTKYAKGSRYGAIFCLEEKQPGRAYLLPKETPDEALSKLHGHADCLEIHGRTLESLVHDCRRGGSVDGLEELAERMVYNVVWSVALLGSTLEFERLMEVHGLETWQEQEIAGDDEDRALNACLVGWNPGNSLRSCAGLGAISPGAVSSGPFSHALRV